MYVRNVILTLLSVHILAGCAPAIVGGAATGVVIAHDTRTTGTVVEDEAIELKVANKIFKDKELFNQTHINVTSYNNNVLVTGETPTEEMRQRVITLTTKTPKVRHVYNEVSVEPPRPMLSRSNDAWITTKIKSNLLRIKDFDSTRVKVVTEKGVVYLMGFLNEQEGTAVAEHVRRISGVRKVVKLFEVPNY